MNPYPIRLLTTRKPIHGFSLIELMVSMTIGLVLMVTIMSAYLGSADAGRVAEAQGRMNEDAHAALTILTQQLRVTGNNPKQTNYVTPESNPVYNTATFMIRGCEGAFGNVTHPLNAAALTCTATAGSLPDSLMITYEADRFNTVATSAGLATDCLGQSLPTVNATVNMLSGTATVATAVTYTVANNLFYVGTSTVITNPSLYCRGNGNATPQPLVENIEDLQLTYGTSVAAATTLTVAGYLSAAEIASEVNLAALPTDADRWGKVLTVRICIVVRSESEVAPDINSARYTRCDGTVNTSPPDRRLRRPYFTTVVLRNRLAL